MKATDRSLSDGKLKNVTGPIIAALRRGQIPRLSVAELSKRLQRRGIRLGRLALMRIENGDRLVLDYELKALAAELGVSVEHLFRGPAARNRRKEVRFMSLEEWFQQLQRDGKIKSQ